MEGPGILLAKMLPNIGGPRPSCRPLVSRVVSSILLYAALMWVDALEKNVTTRKIGAEYRLIALHTCVYRIISEQEVCLIAAMIPINIVVREGQRRYDRAYLTGEPSARRRQFTRSETIVE